MASLAQNVVQGEYFIDTDMGVGNNTQVTFTPSADNNFPVTINLSSYALGYHKLYFRTKDSDGNWSLTSRRNIEVFASEAKTIFATGEYFIDTDPGFSMATPITITTTDSIILQNFSAVASTLSEGYHKLYGRIQDNLGRWSLTFRRNMEVYKNEDNKIINGEYFFKTDNGFGDCNPVTFATPSADGSFVIDIPKNTIPAEADTLFVRIRDDIENRWSITQILPNLKALPLTLLNFSAVKEFNTSRLYWQTTNEVNTAYFNIQRSTDGSHFSNVGVVNAASQKGINDYSYSDNIEGISASILYYRLQEVDIDARATFSKIVTIHLDEIKTGFAIYPNPAKNYFNLIAYKPEDLQGAEISIVDLSGQVLLRQSLQGSANQKISISSLATGMYLIRIVKVTGVDTRKLLKQ
jgi:hypothetical protein